MQRIRVESISPGSIIAEDLFSSEGRMLLSKGAIYRLSYLGGLKGAGISHALVEDEMAALGDEKDGSILEDSYFEPEESIVNNVAYSQSHSPSQAISAAAAFEEYSAFIRDNELPEIHIDDVIYEKTRKQAEHQIMKTMIRLSAMKRAHLDKVVKLVEQIMEELLSKQDVVLHLSKLRSIDDYTYEHSVNVCVIAIVIGIELFMPKETLLNLGVGAILHDIGKVGITERILKKPNILTENEFNEIKYHTELGYHLLKSANFPDEVAIIALSHHERMDGSGYPHKLSGKKIHLLARIVAIADFYDALSNDRVYRKRMTPNNVYRKLIEVSGRELDDLLLERFLRHIHMYPVGIGVLLSTSQKGIVIRQNKLMPESPVVRVFNKIMTDGKHDFLDIDLSISSKYFITDTY